MAASSNLPIIGRRYILQTPLGAGGMGAVYRALDRLTGQPVALKRVLSPDDPLPTTASDSLDFRLALAQEFRLLASLRHPHIISVLDYGFDNQRQPYYAMELLENAQTVMEAGVNQPLVEQVNLLVQMLQALGYLHRRGIIHRDLKPSNVLVTAGQVKLLDFGLSTVQGQENDDTPATAGTLAYMAPEVLSGKPASESSDLYAVGVIAYELFTGRHPFDTGDVTALINHVLYHSPDTSNLNLEPLLALMLDRLLAKAPDARYASAQEVIRELSLATQQPLPEETAATRESFLQAARLVGRETELKTLAQALTQAIDGKGSAWLVGGESGVGKSRLVEELAALGMVQGALVLRGQVVSEGRTPYQLWRPALRWLCLLTELDTAQFSILKVILPDIENLIGQTLPDAQEMNAKAMQGRLLAVIEALFRRQQQPVVVILEDLHWASESLDVLARLNEIVTGLPLLIVGTYRDDERPDLPTRLPGMSELKLRRLAEPEIAKLSEAMLGENGRQAQVVDLLQRETEGNVFFLVEVVRALAEEAGQLDRIGLATLPAQVFVGGVQQVVNRRLNRMPRLARPLLQAAAVMGRQLDVGVLQAIAPRTNLDQWLSLGADAAVLEVHDGQWRFAHDRLREGVLADLLPVERKRLHEKVARAIEKVYPHAPEQAPALAYHFGMAENLVREEYYAARAGEQALISGAYHDAIRFLNRAHELVVNHLKNLTDSERQQQQINLRRQIAEAYVGRGQYQQAAQIYQETLALCQASGDSKCMADTHRSLGDVAHAQSDYDEAKNHYYRALSLYQAIQDQGGITRALNSLGNVAYDTGELNEAKLLYQESLHISRESGSQWAMAGSMGAGNAGPVQTVGPEQIFAEGIAAYQETKDPSMLAAAFQKLLTAEAAEAARLYRQALEQFPDNRPGQAVALQYLGLLASRAGEYIQAEQYLGDALQAAVPNLMLALDIFVSIGGIWAQQARYEAAIELLALTLHHPASGEKTQDEAERLVFEIENRLKASQVTASWERGKNKKFEAALQDILGSGKSIDVS